VKVHCIPSTLVPTIFIINIILCLKPNVVIVDVNFREKSAQTAQGANIRDLIKDRVKKFTVAAKHVLYKKFLTRGKPRKSGSSKSKKNSLGNRVRQRQSVYRYGEEKKVKWAGKQDLINYIDNLLLDETTEEGQYKADLLERLQTSRQDAITLCKSIRERLNDLKKYMYHNHQDEFRRFISLPEGKSEIDLDAEITKSIENSIQRLLLTPIIGLLTNKIKSKLGDELASLKYKLFFLRGKRQKFYDIPKENQSRKQFYKATLELQRMQRTALPNDKLHVLVASARAMHKDQKGTETKTSSGSARPRMAKGRCPNTSFL